jgi:flavin reductase (DIM6/NTAB) family NADH-FMN oxidoreductase RutF
MTEALTSRQLRDAFGLFPTGVAIITSTTASGERLGATVSSFNSVSLDPPLVLFSLAKAAKSHAQWSNVSHYAISVLHEGQADISTRFARPLSEKWEGLAADLGSASNAPLIPDALVWFECEAYAHYEGGDHTIFVGRVVGLEVQPATNYRALVFFNGGYRQVAHE